MGPGIGEDQVGSPPFQPEPQGAACQPQPLSPCSEEQRCGEREPHLIGKVRAGQRKLQSVQPANSTCLLLKPRWLHLLWDQGEALRGHQREPGAQRTMAGQALSDLNRYTPPSPQLPRKMDSLG